MVLAFPFLKIPHIVCSKQKVFSTSVCNFGNAFRLFLKEGGTAHVKIANYSLPFMPFPPRGTAAHLLTVYFCQACSGVSRKLHIEKQFSEL